MLGCAGVAEWLLHQDEREDLQQAVGNLLLEGRDVDGHLAQCGRQRWRQTWREMIQNLFFFHSVPEPEPVEPKLFCGTGAIIIYFGSGSTAPEPQLSF